MRTKIYSWIDDEDTQKIFIDENKQNTFMDER
jgi:hypothetical protein